MNNGWLGNYSYFRARLSGDSVAVVDLDSNTKYTYADLDKRANMLANALKNKYDIKKGDRVAFISRNRIELIDAYFATGKVGAILVPYNARLSVEEFTQLMTNEQPKILFYESVSAATVEKLEAANVVPKFIALDENENSLNHDTYADIVANGDATAASCPELDMDDIHLIIHTGGTTGLPKGGLLSHKCEIFNSFSEICTWGLRYDDKALILLPMFHTGGWNLLTLPMLHAGGTIYINRQFDPKLTLEIVQKEKLTYLFGAATIFRMIVERPEWETADMSSLRWVMSGAAPCPVQLMQQFWDKNIKFITGYGMTEAGPNNLSATPQFMTQELVQSKYASVGKPFYLTLAKIVDDNGDEVTGPNQSGELLWSGPQIFSGYYGNKEETEKTLVDGWVHSGDMAIYDEDGYYYIVGRKKNMYISGGENVFPPEVETAIYEVEAVREVCVIGVPDEKWGEVGKAVVSIKPGMSLTKDELLTALNGKLARYKIPKYVTFVEDVPKNSVGKIVVNQVQKIYGEAND